MSSTGSKSLFLKAHYPLEYIVATINNGGGFYNHQLFWENMTPEETSMSDALEKAIVANFGSVDQFKDEFGTAAKKHFGSGWAWLVLQGDGKLVVTTSANQDNPLMDIADVKGTPILGLDVWEHAYYLHYQNRRPDYINAFWNVVNWKEVEARYSK